LPAIPLIPRVGVVTFRHLRMGDDAIALAAPLDERRLWDFLGMTR
jgi:hypothetical protein